MPLYSARVMSAQGSTSAVLVDADSMEAARRHPTLTGRNILSVRQHWTEWLGLRRIDLSEQRLLLTHMAMQLARGRLSPVDIDRIIHRLPSLKRNRSARKAASSAGLAPHELLLQLNCHPFAVALCREGERLGQVPDMLIRAAEFLSQHREAQQQLRGPLMKSALYIATALLLLVVAPFMFQLLIEKLAARAALETTAATDILMGLHAALTDYLPLSVAALILIVGSLYYFWDHARRLPVFCDFDGLIRARRSSILLSFLVPAFRKGIHLGELMYSLQPLLGNRPSQYLHTRLNAGHRLSQSLSETHFSEALIAGLNQFEDVPASQLCHLFETVQTNLKVEINWRLERIVRTTRWLYTGLLVGLLFLLIQGLLVPIYSIRVT